MNALASTLPEYEVVMGMYGVGKLTVPSSLLRLALFQDLPIGRQSLLLQVSIPVEQSGQHNSKSNKASNVEPAGSVRPCSRS